MDRTPTGVIQWPSLAARDGNMRKVIGVLREMAVTWGPALALVILYTAFSIGDARFASLANLKTLASQSAIPLILATGMTYVILQGSIDLSVEGVMAVSSLSCAMLLRNSRTGFDLGVIALLVGICVGAMFGTLNGILITRLRIPSFMVTLGIWSVTSGIAMLISGGQPPEIRDMSIRGWALGETIGVPNLTLVALVCLVIGYLLQNFTRFGRYTYVIGGSEEIAKLSGVRINFYKVLGFGLCGLTAGLGGVLESARLGLGHVEIGAQQMFLTLTAVVIGGTSLSGGRGGVIQSAVGVLILTVLANGMIFIGVTPYLQKAVQGVIILVAVVAATWRFRARLRVVK
ncbi:MAG TPA: ABC transporter permease [Magnetospirillaceae bacterium]|jgi:ribose transport system permease protein